MYKLTRQLRVLHLTFLLCAVINELAMLKMIFTYVGVILLKSLHLEKLLFPKEDEEHISILKPQYLNFESTISPAFLQKKISFHNKKKIGGVFISMFLHSLTCPGCDKT